MQEEAQRTHYKAVLTRASQSTTAMDFRRVGGQLWIYTDHKAKWTLIPKYVVWFSEQATAARRQSTQGTSDKPTQGRRPHKSTTCQLGEQVASQLKPSKASQEHNLAKSRAHLLQAKAVHTRAAREGNEKFLKQSFNRYTPTATVPKQPTTLVQY